VSETLLTARRSFRLGGNERAGWRERPRAVLGDPGARVLALAGQLDGSRFRRGRGITVAGTPQRGAVVTRARELVRFARELGYRVDELIRTIENVD
jgi:hypothetical protein